MHRPFFLLFFAFLFCSAEITPRPASKEQIAAHEARIEALFAEDSCGDGFVLGSETCDNVDFDIDACSNCKIQKGFNLEYYDTFQYLQLWTVGYGGDRFWTQTKRQADSSSTYRKTESIQARSVQREAYNGTSIEHAKRRLKTCGNGILDNGEECDVQSAGNERMIELRTKAAIKIHAK